MYDQTSDKPSQNDGLIADNAGHVYLTEIGTNAVAQWDAGTADDFQGSRRVIAQVRKNIPFQ